MEHIKVRELTQNEVEAGRSFLFEMVEDLFNKKRDEKIHSDIYNLEEFYLHTKDHILLGAFDKDENIIGTIALKTFINRFKAIETRYDVKTAEVGRCYVRESFRRKGIGKLLFDEAVESSHKLGYKMLYLHTHPHLPGGFDFWLKSGFEVVLVEDENIPTIHMELPLTNI